MKPTVTRNDPSFHESLLRYGDFNFVPIQFYLKPVIDFWLKQTPQDTPEYHFFETHLKDHPFLLQPIDSFEVFKGHERFVELLFAGLMPKADWSRDFVAVAPPFCNAPTLLCTEPYSELVSPKNKFDLLQPAVGRKAFDLRLLYIYKAVLRKFYGLDLTLEHPVIASCLNLESGLTRYFKLIGDTRFVEIEHVGEPPEIDSNEITRLLDQPFDPDAWSRILPIDQFMFKGITILRLVDVTSEEATNRLHYELLNNSYAAEADWLKAIQSELRNIFRLPGLRLGIATIQGNGELNFTSPRPLWNSLFLRELPGEPRLLYRGSLYEQVIRDGKTFILEDLRDASVAYDALLRDEMLTAGFHNMYAAPLFHEDRVIGMLEMLNPDPKGLNGLSLFKINQLKPLFTSALKRHAEEFENRVEAVMLEEFTSIHPKIQWKFREAASRSLKIAVNARQKQASSLTI